MKIFNVTGNCIPEENYMVDIGGKIAEIKKLIENRCYFTINRGRQYGKTTTLNELEKSLADEYIVASISFEGIGDTPFESEENFCKSFATSVCRALKFSSASKEYREKWVSGNVENFDELSEHITNMCEGENVVLMIDEVDRTSNNRIFLHFIGMLRDKFLSRRNGKDYTFHSVILAGVYDIKNIKMKLITEGSYTPTEGENKIYNSPWNIAVDFTVDMSFCPSEIATMLGEYEADHKTGMDISAISEEIYSYTGGYPFLVSRLCQCIDEKLGQDWTSNKIGEAVQIMLEEANTLFDDMFKNIRNYEKLRDFLYDVLFVGKKMPFNIDDEIISLGHMFGFLKNANGQTKVANKIFEMRIYNYFVLQQIKEAGSNRLDGIKYSVTKDGHFDMALCLCKFAEHYVELVSKRDVEFLERHGRLIFLSYLKPLINGEGFYHVESEINDYRMDIVVNYGMEQFIIELKLWHGRQYQKDAYKQILDYMKIKKADKGYLLTFDFRKEKNKKRKVEWVEFDGKKIFEVII